MMRRAFITCIAYYFRAAAVLAWLYLMSTRHDDARRAQEASGHAGYTAGAGLTAIADAQARRAPTFYAARRPRLVQAWALHV